MMKLKGLMMMLKMQRLLQPLERQRQLRLLQQRQHRNPGRKGDGQRDGEQRLHVNYVNVMLDGDDDDDELEVEVD